MESSASMTDSASVPLETDASPAVLLACKPRAAMLARPCLLLASPARISCAYSGCSVSTNCKWCPSADSTAAMYSGVVSAVVNRTMAWTTDSALRAR